MILAAAARILGCATILAIARSLEAQELRGTVRDSASRQPIAGAVLVLLDARGTAIGRNITGANGQYRVALGDAMQRVRFVRIGFRPVEAGIPPAIEGVSRLDVTMAPIASLLSPVVVTDNPNCPRRKDRPQALALWEQARAGLLATIVARDVAPSSMKRLGFNRTMDGTSDRIQTQRVRIDSTTMTSRPFTAVRSAEQFAASGFARDSAGRWTFFGPDADILLDEAFTAAYCFHIADPDRAHPRQAGLAFAPADQRRGRTDIVGTLWVDTLARAIKEIAFDYLMRERSVSGREGGRVAFREMPNGLVVIDQWNIRILGANGDTSFMSAGRRVVSIWNSAYENGGDLARASWADGTNWRASLGTLRVRAVTHQGTPAAGTIVGLIDSDYWSTADSTGALEIADLVPGPYAAVVVHPALASLGLTIPTPLRFTAARDSIVTYQLDVPTLEDFVASRCVQQRNMSMPLDGTAWVFARVTQSTAGPPEGLMWTISVNTGPDAWKELYRARFGSNGELEVCKLALGSTIRITLSREGSPPQIAAERRLDTKVTVIPLAWSPP